MSDLDIVVGYGEIGKAVFDVLNPYYDLDIHDPKQEFEASSSGYRVMHICFGYSKNFIKEVERYKKKFKPKYILVHSTVPIGTCKKIGAAHSPVEGRHPYLAESIRKFVKSIGGKDADWLADYLRYAGIKVQVFESSDATELAKVLSTTYYGVCVEYAKYCKEQCEKYGVPFSEVYTLFNKAYNEGYKTMGFPEYQRPVLQPLKKKIGGHCVLPNLNFLEGDFPELIEKRNTK